MTIEEQHNEALLKQMRIDTKINLILAIVSALTLITVWYDVTHNGNTIKA